MDEPNDFDEMIADDVCQQFDDDDDMMEDDQDAWMQLADEQQQGDDGGNNNNKGDSSAAKRREQQSQAATMHYHPNDDQAKEEEDNEQGKGSVLQSSNNNSNSNKRLKSSPTEDLFSFERYTQRNSWRKTAPDIHESKSWKSISTTAAKTSTTTTTTRRSISNNSPDVQLLQYLAARQSRPSGVVVVVSMSTRPLPPHSMPMTLAGGQRVYIRRRNNQTTTTTTATQASPLSSPQQQLLLGESMTSLMARVRRIRFAKELQSSKTQPRATTTTTTTTTGMNSPQHDDDALWVDKHAPTSFSHLLSDERTNRQVLWALRAWDGDHDDSWKHPKNHQSNYHHEKTQQRPDSNSNNNNNNNNNKQVLLLSGPPGVGKTTLAHIAATHAGYRPYEIAIYSSENHNNSNNNNNNRSTLMERVQAAMESSTLQWNHQGSSSSSDTTTTTTTQNAKPNCVIVDEIDSADVRAVQALVNLIRGGSGSNHHKKSSSQSSSSSRAAASHQRLRLRRPLIFLCHNPHAAALRPLWPYVRHVRVSSAGPHRVVARLRAILTAEGCTVSSSSSSNHNNNINNLLHQLVQMQPDDIRSCLFTLQFAAAGGGGGAAKKDITASLQRALQQGGGGLKDERHDHVAGAVRRVFLLGREEKKKTSHHLQQQRQQQQHTLHRPSSDRVVQAVERFGDHSKLLDCLFLNISRVSYIDPTLDRCAAAHEWLSSADCCSYWQVPAAAGATHLLCRVEQKQDLTFNSKEMYDMAYRLSSNQQLVQKFVSGLPPAACRCSEQQVVAEVIPYALWILSAGKSALLQRAVTSVELLNATERRALDDHVAVLSSLGLCYVARRAEDDDVERNPTLRLEPPIESLVSFGGGGGGDDQFRSNRQEVSQAMKELLARALVHHKLKKRCLHSSTPTTNGKLRAKTRSIASSETKTIATSKKRESSDDVGATRSRRPPKRAKDNSAVVDFLGIGARQAKEARSARNAARVGVQRAHKNRKSHTGSGIQLSQVIRLKYVKGFTQAVRKPCRIEDLM